MAKRVTFDTNVMDKQPGPKARSTQKFSLDDLRSLASQFDDDDDGAYGGRVKDQDIDFSVEYGSTGLRRQGGRIYEEFLPQLRGEKAIQVYREMRENDPVINAICFAIEMLLRKVEWRVDAFSDTPEDEANAEFVRQCMDDMSHSWADMVAEICSMLWFGYSTHEIVYKIRRGPDQEDSRLKSKFNDGRVGWRKIPIRSQDSLQEWDFDDEGGVLGWWQRAWPDFELRYLNITKSLIFRTTSTKNNPEGRSCLRGAYRPWFFKKRIEEIEGVGIERDLAGLPMIRVPAEFFDSKDPAKINSMAGFRTLIEQIRNDERAGVIFPQEFDDNNNPLYSFELLTSGGTRMFDTSGIISRWDERIAMVVLADFIFLGHGGDEGSWALATSKTGLFQSALSAWADSIGETFNKHAIPRLFKLNSMPLDRVPKLAHEEVDAPTLEELGGFITAMATAGWGDMLSDVDLRNMLLKRARLPIPQDEEGDGGEDIDDTNGVLPSHGPGKANLIFAGPTGVVRVSPDGTADIQTASAAPPGAEPPEPTTGEQKKPQNKSQPRRPPTRKGSAAPQQPRPKKRTKVARST